TEFPKTKLIFTSLINKYKSEIEQLILLFDNNDNNYKNIKNIKKEINNKIEDIIKCCNHKITIIQKIRHLRFYFGTIVKNILKNNLDNKNSSIENFLVMLNSLKIILIDSFKAINN